MGLQFPSSFHLLCHGAFFTYCKPSLKGLSPSALVFFGQATSGQNVFCSMTSLPWYKPLQLLGQNGFFSCLCVLCLGSDGSLTTTTPNNIIQNYTKNPDLVKKLQLKWNRLKLKMESLDLKAQV